MTVLDLIKSSLRLIGQLGPGRSPGTSETADALLVLNSMLEAWGADRLCIYSIARAEHNLAAGTASYTIGATGAWNVARPIRIEAAGLVTSNGEYPLEVFTPQKWAEITPKSQAGTPQGIYYDPTFPLGTIYPWPVPIAADKLALYTWLALSSFSSASDTVSLPPGYADAIRYNLAVKLAPEWGKAPREDVLMLARKSLAVIQNFNTPVVTMDCDGAILGGHTFDITIGE